jgi:hypothetical protein
METLRTQATTAASTCRWATAHRGDPKASVRQRLRACEPLAIIAEYIEGRSQAEAEAGKGLRGRALPPTASRGNSKSISSLAELVGKLE